MGGRWLAGPLVVGWRSPGTSPGLTKGLRMNNRPSCRTAAAAFVSLWFGSAASAQSCVADITGNRVVDGSDLANVLAQWGPCGPRESCSADTNDDGVVNGVDLGNVLAAWGLCPVTVPGWATLIEAYPNPAVVHDASLRASIVATGYAWRVRDTSTQIELVLIPPGTFQMGCSASNLYTCGPWESPVHTVSLTNAFYMGRYEVTQAQWTARMGSNPSSFQSPSAQVPADQVSSRPVERVSWNMIQGFLSDTGMRLPTEAEWEYAYRAGTSTAFHSMPGYPSGTNDDAQIGLIEWIFTGSCTSGAACQTRPVGRLAGNGFGLHDMGGNVQEWVNDWYSASYYASSPPVNPLGPSSGSHRVLRGSSWDSFQSMYSRSSQRMYAVPSNNYLLLGFRVARSP